MIERWLLEQIEQSTRSSAFRITDSKNHSSDATMHDGSGAHGTGFFGHIQVAVRQTPVAEGFLRLAESEHFCMGCSIAERLHLIVSAGDDLTVVDNHRSDRDFPRLHRTPSLAQGLLHEEVVSGELNRKIVETFLSYRIVHNARIGQKHLQKCEARR